MNNIQELFAVPVGLHPVVSINGTPLYGSYSLNKKFIESLKTSKRGKMVSKTIERMVNTGQIIPCFAEKGIMSYFKSRLAKNTSGGLLRVLRKIVIGKNSGDNALDYILAFYDFDKNAVIILINNNIEKDFSMTASDNAIAISLLHEMMHMFAHQNPYKFLDMFEDDLNSYYKAYFTKIFKLEYDKNLKNTIEEIYRYLFLKVEMEHGSDTSILNKLEPFSNLNKDEFKKVLNDYDTISKIAITNDVDKFITLEKKEYKSLIAPLYTSYKTAFGKLPIKGCSQEMVYPSEVICGYTDIKPDSNIINALQSLI